LHRNEPVNARPKTLIGRMLRVIYPSVRGDNTRKGVEAGFVKAGYQ